MLRSVVGTLSTRWRTSRRRKSIWDIRFWWTLKMACAARWSGTRARSRWSLVVSRWAFVVERWMRAGLLRRALRIRHGIGFPFRGFLPGNKVVQVIAERAIGAELVLVKQPLGAAAQANLIGTSLNSDRPAHAAVPAAAEGHHGRSRQTGGHDSGPPPAGLLEFCSSLPLDCVGHRSSHLLAFWGASSSSFLTIGRIAAEGKI